MKILLYLLVPVLIVAVVAAVGWIRNRQPTSLESGVDAFQREMQALSPDAAPSSRRRPLDDDGPPPLEPRSGAPRDGGRPPGRPR
jgi:hypothetical protein